MTIKELNEKTDAVIEKRDKEIEKVRDAIVRCKSAIPEAEDKMNEAVKDGNVQHYSKAKEVKAAATDKLELSTARLKYLNEEPQITKEEYDNAIKAVRETESKRCLEAKRKVVELIEQALAICEKDAECANALNAATQRWQEEAYRNADNRHRNKNSGKWEKINVPTNHWYGDMTLRYFLEDIRASKNYIQISAEVKESE